MSPSEIKPISLISDTHNKLILLKNFKLFRIIPKKKKNFLNFFQKFWGPKASIGPHDGPPATGSTYLEYLPTLLPY